MKKLLFISLIFFGSFVQAQTAGVGYDAGNFLRQFDKTNGRDTVRLNFDISYTSGTFTHPIDSIGLYFTDTELANSEIDDLFDDLDANGSIDGTLYITGTNGSRTASSDESYYSLVANGWDIQATTTITLIHAFQVGASTSAGGAGSYPATPSLTSTSDVDVFTLTDGPLAASTSGSFIPLIEGDTYDQDAVPQSHANVESSASGLGQQLAALIGDSNYKICVTYHYRGGTALQLFNDGESQEAFGYDEMTATITRVKALCDANGWNYVPHLVLVQSVSGISTTAVEDWVDNIRAFVTPTYYSGTLKVLVTQGKIAGTPDYGETAYTSAYNRSDVQVTFPVRNIVISGEVQADNIHYTNHGQRRIGVNTAYAIYDNIIGSGFLPLTIDQANISYNDGVEEITIPILNASGALQGSGDHDIVVYDATASLTVTGTWSISGTNLIFNITGNKPNGTSTIEFRADQGTGTLTDSRSNSSVIFNAANAAPYSVVKPLIRHDFSKSLTFPSDVTAPIISSPTDIKLSASTASGTVVTDEGNGTLYFVSTTSATTPSVAQVKAGQDNSSAAATYASSQAVVGTGTQNVSITGLSGSTTYYIHYVHTDAANNDSNVSSADGFTTDAASTTVLKRFNFGQTGTPAVTDWEKVGGEPMTNTSTDVVFSDPGSWGGFSFTAKNTSTTNKWGFINNTASGAANLGTTTGANTGIVPDNVLTYYWYTQGGTDLVIHGFDDLESYTLRLVPARATSSSRITQYIIGGVTQTLEANGNTANEVVYTGVTSTSGNVTINVSTTTPTLFGYVNSLIIELE